MGMYVLDFEVEVEAMSLEKANEKRVELEKLIKSQFAEGELHSLDSYVEEEEDEKGEEDTE